MLIVDDSGPGIAEERLLHLFDPFDRAGRRDSEGLGLGLSRRIAERMGGSPTAENRDGGGARFTFALTAAESIEAASSGLPLQACPRPLDIMIVEDTTPVCRLMARLLALDGHSVVEGRQRGR